MRLRIILPIVVAALLVGAWQLSVSAAVSAIYTVNMLDDLSDANLGDGICDTDLTTGGSQCSFRAAVEEANVNPNYDLIGLPAGTYTITGDAIEIITGSLEIRGAFNGGTILDGATSDSGLLFLRHGAVVTATRLTLQNGQGGCFPVYGCATGGAITNLGELTLSDSTVHQNRVSANGGAIMNGHRLTLDGVLVEGNRAGQVGGGIYSAGYNYPGVLIMRDSVIQDNLSSGGGGLYIADTDAFLDNVDIIHNAAFGTPTHNSYGGGLTIKSSSGSFTVSIQNSTFADNYSEASGGAIFSSNTLIMNRNEFRHNRAAQLGGALFVQLVPPQLNNTIFYGNWAGYHGGAIFQNFVDMDLASSAIFDNEAIQDGGGLYVRSGQANLENVTFSDNLSGRDGGALYLGGNLTGHYLTFAENQAANGGLVAFAGGDLTLGSSVVGPHSGGVCAQPSGSFTSAGYNVFSATTGCSVTATTADQFGVDPLLDPLADNGGPEVTLTHAPGAGSPVVEAGDAATCPATDQRGVPRPVGAACDAGAVEFHVSVSSRPWSPEPALPLFVYATYPVPVPGTVLIVDSLAGGSDATIGDGICATTGGECTLRAAIQESNSLPGQETIQLPAGIIDISSQLPEISDHLIVNGAGVGQTILNRLNNSQAVRSGYSTIIVFRNLTMQGASRFISSYGHLTLENCLIQNNSDSAISSFYVYGETMPVDDPLPEVVVRNCTFQNNVGAFNGPAILSSGKLTIDDSLFLNNQGTNGGAIYTTGGAGVTEAGDIIVRNSRFEGNSAESQGGAIRSRWSRIVISNTLFLNNQVTGGSQPQGGAIATSSWLTITDSYFAGNAADYAGGAIANGGEWNLDVDPAILAVNGSTFINNSSDYGGGLAFTGQGEVTNSTFSGNQALRDGGGILIGANSTGVLNSVTVVNNTADSDGDSDGAGGGLQLSGGLWDEPGGFTIVNSIFANNAAFTGPDCSSPAGIGLSLGGNLIRDLTDCGVTTVGSDLSGIDPQLGPLVNVQNHNRVHLPLPGSPILNTGSGCPAVDQRGVPRSRCDRGSVELTPPQTFLVNAFDGAADIELGDGVCLDSNGKCSFAAAVAEAAVWNYEDSVQLPAGTFASDDVIVNGGDLTIFGAGAGQTILAANLSGSDARVLATGEASNPNQQILIRDLTIQGGSPVDIFRLNGGGILNAADLTLLRVSVQDNWGASGGGIYNQASGQLTITDSAILNNTASWVVGLSLRGSGGGLANFGDGGVTLVNVTLSGNSAVLAGGGLVHNGIGLLTLQQVTVASNQTTDGYGGGIVNGSTGILSLINTIVGNNSATSSDPDCSGAVLVVRNRVLIENNSTNCLPSSMVLTGDPLLARLSDNGGPTLTHALQGGSAAVDVGGAVCPATDQRGYSRAGDCDLGAYELAGIPTAIGLQSVGVVAEPAGLVIAGLTILLLALATLLTPVWGRRYDQSVDGKAAAVD